MGDRPYIDPHVDYRRFGLLNTEAVRAGLGVELATGRRIVPDTAGDWPRVFDAGAAAALIEKHGFLTVDLVGPIVGIARRLPSWNSVALFFNLPDPRRPGDYTATTAADVRNWLDEGASPAAPGLSNFVQDYWLAVSYGRLNFGIEVPRDAGRTPLVPTIDADAQDWVALAQRCLEANPEAVWKAGGSKVKQGRRWLPSLVVVQHYWSHASAKFRGWTQTIDGHEYEIGDVTHLPYDLTLETVNGVATTARRFWGTLTHEFAHNFLEFPDLYGPQGCTGYWDLLGDNTPPTSMSEICSVFKQRVGWLAWKHIISGPRFARTTLSLRPYGSSGDAVKVVPDPVDTPLEYFVLEYRKSLGREVWRPDGALRQ